jgi:signal peptidase I
MPEADTVPNQPEPSETPEVKKPALHGGIWHFSVALLSAAIPGVGQISLGARRKGTLLLAAFGLFVLAIWPLRVMTTYSGYVISVCAFLVLVMYSSCSALLGASERTVDRPSRWWVLLFVPLAIAFLCLDYALLTHAAGFRSFSIPSTSMEQTLVPGDRFIVDTHYYRHGSPNRGDIVMFYRNKTFFLKRVIAIAGDTIQGTNGAVPLNGQVLIEKYIQHVHGGSDVAELNTFGPITVPSGEYFVMGDNRDVSYDSRSHDFGFVSGSTIAGKPLYIYASAADRSGKTLR